MQVVIPFTPEQLADMLARYQRNEGMETIGEKFGISRTAVRKRLVEMGAELRTRGRPSHQRIEE